MTHNKEEILLLIVKYLKHIGSFELAKSLQDEINDKKLLCKSISWDGKPLSTSFDILTSPYDHIPNNFLEGLLSQFIKFLDDKVPSTTTNIKSLLGSGRFHSLRSSEDVNQSIIKSRYESSTHLYKNSLGALHHHQIFGVGSFSYQSLYRELNYRATIMGHRDAAYCITFDKTNEYLITGGDDGMVKIWHIKSLQLINCLRGHAGPITDISVSYDNRILVTGSCDSYVIIWCLMSGRPLHTMSLFASNVMINAIVCSPLTRVTSDVYWIVVTASKEGRIVFIPYRYKQLNCGAHHSMSHNAILSASETSQEVNGEINDQNPWFNVPGRVDIELLPMIKFIECVRPANSMLCIGFSRGGFYMAGGCHDHIVRVYAFKDDKTVEKIGDLIGHTGAVDSLCYANHSSRFATGSVDGTCRIWWFENHEWKSLEFSIKQKSKTTLSGSNQKSAKIVPANIAWTSDDQRLITSVSDFSIQIWDTNSGTFLFCLPKLHTHNVYGLSPSYRSPHLLITAGRDGRVVVWDLLLRDSLYEYLDTEATGYMDGVLSEDGTVFATVDFLGRFSIFQLGSLNMCQEGYVPEQFFHWELDSCKWSSSNPAILLHQPSEIPFHRLPPPYLTNYRGFLHDMDIQRRIRGREHLQTEDDLYPTLVSTEEDEIIVDDIQLARNVPLAPGENAPIRSSVPGLETKNYLNKSYWLEHNMILPLRQVDIVEDNTFYSSLADLEMKELENDRPIKMRVVFANEIKKEPEKREKQFHLSPVERVAEVIDSNSSDSDISDWTPTVGERALSAPKRKTVKQRRRPVTRNSGFTNGAHSVQNSTSRLETSSTSNRSKRANESSTPCHSHLTRANRSLNESTVSTSASGSASCNTTDDSTSTSELTSTSRKSGSSSLSDRSSKVNQPATSGPSLTRKRRLIRQDSSSSGTSKAVYSISPVEKAKTPNRRLKFTSRITSNADVPVVKNKPRPSFEMTKVPSSSETAERLNEEAPVIPEWLTSVYPKHSPYVPQMGDEVVYFYQGHQLYVEAVKQKKVYPLSPNKEMPWLKFRDIKPYEYLRVYGLKFDITEETDDYPQIRLCRLKLRFFNPDTGKPERKCIEFSFHDMDNVLDFVVLKQSFDSALMRKWKKGDKFRSIVDNKWYSGTIIEEAPYDPSLPDSPWQRYIVKWATGETERISPWDLMPIAGSDNSLTSLGEEEMPFLQYEPVMIPTDEDACDWPLGRGRDDECDRIARCISQIKDLGIAEDFISPVDLEKYPDYAKIVAYPIDLMTIEERLKNRYYRRSIAVHFEVRLIANNAELYNREGSSIAKNAVLISNLCEKVVSDLHMTNIMPTYKEMTSKSRTSTAGNVPTTSSSGTQSSYTQMSQPGNLSWPSRCRNLLVDLKKQEFSYYFRKPIDLKEYSDYPYFVTNPMDLTTITNKLGNALYKTPADFQKDLKLIVRNSKMYNKNRKLRVYSDTDEFNEYIDEKMSLIISEFQDEVLDKQKSFHKMDRRNRERRRPFSTSRFRNGAPQYSNSRRIGRRRGIYTEPNSDEDISDQESPNIKDQTYKTRYGRQINIPHLSSSSENELTPQIYKHKSQQRNESSSRRQVAFQNDDDEEEEEEEDIKNYHDLLSVNEDSNPKTRTSGAQCRDITGSRSKRATRFSGSFLDNQDEYESDEEVFGKQKKRKLQPINAKSSPTKHEDHNLPSSSKKPKRRILNLSEQENDGRIQDSPTNSLNHYPKRSSAARRNYCEDSDDDIFTSKRSRQSNPTPAVSVSRSGRIRKEPAFFSECER